MLEFNSIIRLAGLWLDPQGQVMAKQLHVLDPFRRDQVKAMRDEIRGYLTAAIESDRADLQSLVQQVDDVCHRLDERDPSGDHRTMLARAWPKPLQSAARSEVL